MNPGSVTHATHVATDTSAPNVNATFRKVTLRVLPLLFLCYLVAYLDRVNVSFAKLNMLTDLNFSSAVYGLGAGMFFIGYFLFEIPSNMILHRVGARRWIARIMITWGVLSAAMAWVQTPTAFYVLRFLLGMAEAGFYPGVLLYLTLWFPSARRGRITALFMAGNPVSGIIGGPLSGFIMHAFAGLLGFTGWQWLFLVEALPALILGVVVLFYLDDSVDKAKWLSAEEKKVLSQSIEADASTKTHVSVASVFRSPRVWLLCLVYFGISIGSNTFGFWQPTIIKDAGVGNPLFIGLLTTLPYIAALFCMLLAGRSADRMRERRWHVVIPILLAAIGFLMCALCKGQIVPSMFGLVLVAIGIICAIPMFWALPTSFLGGAGAAAGIALINCTGNLGGFVSPVIMGWLTTTTESLTSGLYLVTGWLVLTAALIIVFVPAKVVNR
jgi:D-galactonate transporter